MYTYTTLFLLFLTQVFLFHTVNSSALFKISYDLNFKKIFGKSTEISNIKKSVDWGCGIGNRKCECTSDGKDSLHIHGQGSEATATGLVFNCSFHVLFVNVSACDCVVQTNIPYSGDNHFSVDCPCAHGFTKFESLPKDGHDFSVTDEIIPGACDKKDLVFKVYDVKYNMNEAKNHPAVGEFFNITSRGENYSNEQQPLATQSADITHAQTTTFSLGSSLEISTGCRD